MPPPLWTCAEGGAATPQNVLIWSRKREVVGWLCVGFPVLCGISYGSHRCCFRRLRIFLHTLTRILSDSPLLVSIIRSVGLFGPSTFHLRASSDLHFFSPVSSTCYTCHYRLPIGVYQHVFRPFLFICSALIVQFLSLPLSVRSSLCSVLYPSLGRFCLCFLSSGSVCRLFIGEDVTGGGEEPHSLAWVRFFLLALTSWIDVCRRTRAVALVVCV